VAHVYEHVAPKPLVSPLQPACVTDVDVGAHLSPHALQLAVVFRSPHPESKGASGDEPSGAIGESTGASVPPSFVLASLASTGFDVSCVPGESTAASMLPVSMPGDVSGAVESTLGTSVVTSCVAVASPQ
jgi:hypothetical protein